MDSPTLALGEFSRETLAEALASKHAHPAEIARHGHLDYLFGYLTKLSAQSLLVEDPYVDGDYLDDYTVYYAKCFSDFGRWCKRLHFFDTAIPPETFNHLRAGSSVEEAQFLQKHYLGFVVARPLPEAVVGRTVLKTYDDENGGRHRVFPATKTYEANLCGTGLSIDSLAFQEQDTVLAACATVALWSAFHKTAELFHTPIPTPASITRTASQAIHYGRPIPSSGLQIEEICTAIRDLQLEPELIDLRSGGMVPVPSVLYGYLTMGLPVLLVIEIAGVGFHAVTLAGYSVLDAPERTAEVQGVPFIPLKGRRIDKLYGHDDQIGPFSRIAIHDAPTGSTFPIRLETSWKDQHHVAYDVYPYAIVVPVYNKVRLRFTDVLNWVTPLDAVFSDMFPEGADHEWDVHLILSNKYKTIVRLDSERDTEQKKCTLSAHHPRFWWRAVLSLEGRNVVKLLFDATGISRSLPLTEIVWLSDSFGTKLGEELSTSENRQVALDMLGSERLLSLLQTSIAHRKRPFSGAAGV